MQNSNNVFQKIPLHITESTLRLCCITPHCDFVRLHQLLSPYKSISIWFFICRSWQCLKWLIDWLRMIIIIPHLEFHTPFAPFEIAITLQPWDFPNWEAAALSMPSRDHHVSHAMCQSYLGSLPDDVLDLVGLVTQLFVSQGFHGSRKSVILKQSLLLEVLLFEKSEVLSAEAQRLVHRSFPIPAFSLPDQPVAEKARRSVRHHDSPDGLFFLSLIKNWLWPPLVKSYKPKNLWHKSKQLISDWPALLMTCLHTCL